MLRCTHCQQPLAPGVAKSDFWGSTICPACLKEEERRTWLTTSSAGPVVAEATR